MHERWGVGIAMAVAFASGCGTVGSHPTSSVAPTTSTRQPLGPPTAELPTPPDPHALHPRSCPRSGNAGDRLHVAAPLPILGINLARVFWWSGNGIVFMGAGTGPTQQITTGAHLCAEGGFFFALRDGALYGDVIATNQLQTYPPDLDLIAEHVRDYRLVRLTGTPTRVAAAYLDDDSGQLVVAAPDGGEGSLLSERCAALVASCEESEGAGFVLCRTAGGELLDVPVAGSPERLVPFPVPTGAVDCADGHVVYSAANGGLTHLERTSERWSEGGALGGLAPVAPVQSIRMLTQPLRIFALTADGGTTRIQVARVDLRGRWTTATALEMPQITAFDVADIYGREEAVLVVRVHENTQSSVYMTRQLDQTLSAWSPPQMLTAESGLPYD